MDIVDRETLTRLAAHRGWPALSIYLPTHREITANEGDRIRLKNLLRDATESLVEGGMRRPEAESFLSSSVRVTVDGLWTGGFEGLALFAYGDRMDALRLATTVPEQMVVGDRLYLRPLYTAAPREHTFWALALDRNRARLFKGDHRGIEPVELPPDTPLSFDDEARYYTREREMQFRSVAQNPANPGRGAAQFHGHGGEKDIDKVELGQFLTHLEHGVSQVTGAGTGIPLVLLGVEYMIAAYRLTSGYPDLVEVQVNGATDYLEPDVVQAKALEALRPREEAALEAEIDELRAKDGTGLASTDPDEIAAAAAVGRVRSLFFDDSAGPWGTLDRDTLTVSRVCEAQPRLLREQMASADVTPKDCGWDLVDLAAAETVLHAGAVHSFTGEDAPVHGVAALYRY